MTYTCKVCGVTGDADIFYTGVMSRCKECHKAAVKLNREEKADYYRNYDAFRFHNDPKVRDRHKRYQSTQAGKEAMARSRLKWINKTPEARAAHVILGNAVKGGRLEKPTYCSRCGVKPKRRDMHAHHEDYAKPLDVIWLCVKCHNSKHNRWNMLHVHI
jgi:hypothetical protein